jgi:hypothetical protein
VTVQDRNVAARHASAALTRGGAIASLGTAALLAIALFAFASETRASKKTKRIKLKKCKKQAGKCRAAFEAECQGDPACDPLLACCDLFSSCDADAGLRCIFTPQEVTR